MAPTACVPSSLAEASASPGARSSSSSDRAAAHGPGNHGQVRAAIVEQPDPSTSDADASTRLVLDSRCRDLRRRLTPIVWAVLEDVALDATRESGRFAAATSSRRVAQQLAIAPGTAARALRILRDLGWLSLDQRPDAAGRFGLAVYTIQPIPGLSVAPRASAPHAVAPGTAPTDTDTSHGAESCPYASGLEGFSSAVGVTEAGPEKLAGAVDGQESDGSANVQDAAPSVMSAARRRGRAGSQSGQEALPLRLESGR